MNEMIMWMLVVPSAMLVLGIIIALLILLASE